METALIVVPVKVPFTVLFLDSPPDKIILVKIFIGESELPVDTFAIDRTPIDEHLADIILQDWVISGRFRKAIITELSLIRVLEIAQQERLKNVEWFRKTYRFLRDRDFPPCSRFPNSYSFILTNDKSDLSPLDRLTLKFGEKRARQMVEEQRQTDEAQEIEERERQVLEVLPQDPDIKRAFRGAVEGSHRVVLVVKGSRPMYLPMAQFGYTHFALVSKDNSADFVIVPTPTICVLAGVDPGLIQDIYFTYRNQERQSGISQWLDRQISLERKKIITNLLPFPEITWKRYSGSTGEEYVIARTRKALGVIMDLEKIRRLCQPDTEA